MRGRELVFLLYNVGFALERLQQHGLSPCQLPPSSVGCSPAREYRLFFPVQLAAERTACLLLQYEQRKAFLPPALLRGLAEAQALTPAQARQSCLYSLAMLIARASGCTLQQIEDPVLHEKHLQHLLASVRAAFPELAQLFESLTAGRTASVTEFLEDLSRLSPKAEPYDPALAAALFEREKEDLDPVVLLKCELKVLD